jgi:hypothetical protein
MNRELPIDEMFPVLVSGDTGIVRAGICAQPPI